MSSSLVLNILDCPNSKNGKHIQFSGDLDSTNASSTLDTIVGLINNGCTQIIADFEDLRYINSMGMGILIHLNNTARERGGLFVICNLNDNVLEVIELIGAHRILTIVDDIKSAQAKLV